MRTHSRGETPQSGAALSYSSLSLTKVSPSGSSVVIAWRLPAKATCAPTSLSDTFCASESGRLV